MSNKLLLIFNTLIRIILKREVENDKLITIPKSTSSYQDLDSENLTFMKHAVFEN